MTLDSKTKPGTVIVHVGRKDRPGEVLFEMLKAVEWCGLSTKVVEITEDEIIAEIES